MFLKLNKMKEKILLLFVALAPINAIAGIVNLCVRFALQAAAEITIVAVALQSGL